MASIIYEFLKSSASGLPRIKIPPSKSTFSVVRNPMVLISNGYTWSLTDFWVIFGFYPQIKTNFLSQYLLDLSFSPSLWLFSGNLFGMVDFVDFEHLKPNFAVTIR